MKAVPLRHVGVILLMLHLLATGTELALATDWHGWKPVPPGDRTTVALCVVPGRDSGFTVFNTALYSVRTDGTGVDEMFVTYPGWLSPGPHFGPNWSSTDAGATTVGTACANANLTDTAWETPFLFTLDSQRRIHWGPVNNTFFEVDGLAETNKAPCAVGWDGKLHLFVTGIRSIGPPPVPGGGGPKPVPGVPGMKAGHIYTTSMDAAGYPHQWWTTWTEVPAGEYEGLTDAALTATLSRDDRTLYLFAKGIKDNQVYVNALGKKSGTWSGWQLVPGDMTTDMAMCATTGDANVHLFAVRNRRIFMNTRRGAPILLGKNPWVGWEEVSGNGTTDAPVAATVLKGKIFVFAKGIDDKGIYYNQEK